MGSNLPPGVSGNEPQITGEIDLDPHAPFWVGDDDEGDGFTIFFGGDEDLFFDGFDSEQEAEDLARTLNEHYSLREPDPDPKSGICRICHDLHGPLPGLEEEEARERAAT